MSERCGDLLRQWAAEGLGWEDCLVLLEKRGMRVPREHVRLYVLKLNRFMRRPA